MLRILLLLVLTFPASLQAGEAEWNAATKSGRDIVLQAGRNWQKNKVCFACHHQTLPMLAVIETAKSGFPEEKDWLNSQSEFTQKFFESQAPRMKAEQRLGGGSYTAAYGLWALHLNKHKADATTAETVKYLLRIQGEAQSDEEDLPEVKPKQGPWLISCQRPPMMSSEIGATVLSLYGLEQYGEKTKVTEAKEKAAKWLASAKLKDTEDRFWRLWGLHHLAGKPAEIEKLQTAILKEQRGDGGWSQIEKLESDAYATGQTLYVLRLTGLAANDPALIKAAGYLVKTQCADGSWHVKARAKPVQPNFDNGDPHGRDQFLSVTATSWATAALARMCLR